MAERQRGSQWYAATNADRKRKQVMFTLSDEARDALDALAEARGETKSAIVEAEILRAFADLQKK